MTRSGSTTTRIYHVRFWGLWLGLALMWLLVQLPHALQMRLSRRIGQLLHLLAHERRRVAETNIGLCFPERSPDDRKRLVQATFESFGMSIMETGTAWLRGVDHLENRCEISGLEHLAQAHSSGRGVLLIGAHFSTLDLAGALAARHIQMDVVYRPSTNPVFEWLQQRGRRRHFGRTYRKSQTRDIIRGLREGRTIWYAQDQNFSRRVAIFAPFFGIPAATIRGATRLVTLSNATAIFFSHFRLDGGRRYRLDFAPMPDSFPGDDEAADAAHINRLIENALREHPEQYLWLHRRFKTRPAGEPPIYAARGWK